MSVRASYININDYLDDNEAQDIIKDIDRLNPGRDLSSALRRLEAKVDVIVTALTETQEL